MSEKELGMSEQVQEVSEQPAESHEQAEEIKGNHEEAGSAKLLPLPDVGDLLFCGIMYILLVARPTYMFQDASTGWHLVTGQWIFENHRIPYTDLFSYTFPDKAWVAYEWLFDLGAYLLTYFGGLNLLAVGISAIISFVFMKVYDRARALGGPLAITTFIAIVGIFGSGLHWLARPHVITFLCVYLFVSSLDDFYRGTISNTRLLLTITLGMLLWVNCHPAFPLGGVLCAIFFLCSLPSCIPDRGVALAKSQAKRRSLVLLLACVAAAGASLLNPYGLELHKYIAEYLRGSTLIANTDEYKSPVFHGDLSAVCLEVLVVILLTALVVTRKRLTLPYFSLLILFLHMALTAVRNIPLFAIVSVPAISALYEDIRKPDSIKRIQQVLPGALTAAFDRFARPFREFAVQENLCKMHILPVLYVVFVTIASLNGGNLAGMKILSAGFSPSEMPTKTLIYIKEHNLPYDRGFNYDNWGGLIRYKLGQRVFIDDRADFYGETFYNKYGAVVQVQPGWQDILNQYKIKWILIPINAKLAGPLKSSPEWKIACQDEGSYLFVRN